MENHETHLSENQKFYYGVQVAILFVLAYAAIIMILGVPAALS